MHVTVKSLRSLLVEIFDWDKVADARQRMADDGVPTQYQGDFLNMYMDDPGFKRVPQEIESLFQRAAKQWGLTVVRDYLAQTDVSEHPTDIVLLGEPRLPFYDGVVFSYGRRDHTGYSTTLYMHEPDTIVYYNPAKRGNNGESVAVDDFKSLLDQNVAYDQLPEAIYNAYRARWSPAPSLPISDVDPLADAWDEMPEYKP